MNVASDASQRLLFCLNCESHLDQVRKAAFDCDGPQPSRLAWSPAQSSLGLASITSTFGLSGAKTIHQREILQEYLTPTCGVDMGQPPPALDH